MDAKTKKIGGRAVLAFVYVALLVVFFLTGRTHTILIDNKADPDGAWQAVRGMTVSVNGREPVEYLRGDRDREIVKGQKFSIRIEFFDGRDPFEATLRVPLSVDTLLLSVPKLIDGIEPAMEKFDIYGANRATTAAGENERFGQPEAEPETDAADELPVIGF
ncbi:MAG: hypothetical protein JXP39_06770 [Spirochaetales bacterium]|nr:hypothetical protein [Spirochaetales bacterium]